MVIWRQTGLPLTSAPDWKDHVPITEKGAYKDDADRFHQFVRYYGSHYLSSLTIGYRIAIRAELESLEQTTRTSFATDFKAWGNAWKVGAGQGSSQSETIRRYHTQIEVAMGAGTLLRAAGNSGNWEPVEVAPTGLDAVAKFLTDLTSDTQTYRVAPGPVEGR